MPVGAFVPSRIHLDYAEWQTPVIGDTGKVWSYTGSGYAPVALAFDPAGTADAAVAAHVAATNPHTQYYLASGVSVFGASLIDDADAATARQTLGVRIGTDVQAYDAELAAIAGLTSAADRLPYFTGSGTAALATFTSFGRSLTATADASAARSALGLGTAAVLNVGTSANNIVQLDGSAKLPAVDGSQLTGVVATTSPGGSNTQVQYNASGSLAGDAGLTYNASTDRLTIVGGIVAPSIRPASDSTTAVQLQNAAGTAVVTVDTTTPRVVFGGDLFTDRWLSSQTNVGVGVGVFGVGTLAHTAGNEGWNNVAIGYRALYAATTGSDNVGIGYRALAAITIGYNNVGLGTQAGYQINTGSGNMAIGSFALASCTIGSGNVAVGENAMLSLTTAIQNVAIGSSALRTNQTGSENVAIGKNALRTTTGGANVAIGSDALNKDTTGENNIGIGYLAGYSITTGGDNVAIGYFALVTNTIGVQNTAIGRQAGNSATGDRNVFLGYKAGYSDTNSDRLHIGNAQAKSLLLGKFDTDCLAIGFSDLSTPTAAVDCAPSTTARASLRVRAGTAPTTPNAGDIYFNGTNFFGYNGSAWKQLDN